MLVPLDDIVVFPNMNVTLSAEVGDEKRVLLVPRHEDEYAKVGTVARVTERVWLPGGARVVGLEGLHGGLVFSDGRPPLVEYRLTARGPGRKRS